ncbi:hypothetical protein [Nocardioides sp.]|nr:hypothetical protein [Nocardioides sp.]
MRHQIEHRRRTWHSLTPEQKQERLRDLRRNQQAQIELEVRRLHHR